MDDEEGRPGDVSPVNPGAVRGPTGIWNEETLPVTEWESPEHRVVVPTLLQSVLNLEQSVLRWSQEKLDTITSKRPELVHIIENLDSELNGWQWIGIEKDTGYTRVLFIGSNQRYYALTLGEDRNGSWNAITIVGSSNPGFVGNRLRGVRDIKNKD